MQLARYLDKLFQKDGFLLIDANSNKYIIGTPKKNNPITVKILDKKLHYKLFFRPDLYFGEAYSNGDLQIINGSLTDFLDIALMNIGSYVVKEEDIIEIRDKSKQLAFIDIALANKERETPEYIQLDEKNKKVTFVRTPKFDEVPYPVVMEPNLVIEYYSR